MSQVVAAGIWTKLDGYDVEIFHVGPGNAEVVIQDREVVSPAGAMLRVPDERRPAPIGGTYLVTGRYGCQDPRAETSADRDES